MAQSEVDHELLKRLGDRIRQIRVQKGFTQEHLADVAGVHRTYIGMIERGEKNTTFLSLVKVSDALGVSLGYVFEGLHYGK